MGCEEGAPNLDTRLTEDVGTRFHDVCRFDNFLSVRQVSQGTSRKHVRTNQNFPGELCHRISVWNGPSDKAVRVHTFHTANLNKQDRIMVA